VEGPLSSLRTLRNKQQYAWLDGRTSRKRPSTATHPLYEYKLAIGVIGVDATEAYDFRIPSRH
jgi:hypothetical protein